MKKKMMPAQPWVQMPDRWYKCAHICDNSRRGPVLAQLAPPTYWTRSGKRLNALSDTEPNKKREIQSIENNNAVGKDNIGCNDLDTHTITTGSAEPHATTEPSLTH